MNIDEEIFITNSFEETQKLGEKFAKRFFARRPLGEAIIALYGELGSGKTTFVQGMAKGLGIRRRIISPTFIIIRSYKIKNQKSSFDNASDKNIKYTNKKLKMFYHIDLYRIKSDKDIEGLGLDEIIDDPKNIVAIEWAEKIGGLLSRKRWDVGFEDLGEDERRITIKN